MVCRLDVLAQQGCLGRSCQVGFARADEGFSQRPLRHRVRGLEVALEMTLILRADIQGTAQTGELHHRQRGSDRFDVAARRREGEKPGRSIKGVVRAFALFEIVQRGLQQRDAQHFEVAHTDVEECHLQGFSQDQQGFMHIQIDLELLTQGLDQQGLGKGVDVLHGGHGLVEGGLCGEAGAGLVVQGLELGGGSVAVPVRHRRRCLLELGAP